MTQASTRRQKPAPRELSTYSSRPGLAITPVVACVAMVALLAISTDCARSVVDFGTGKWQRTIIKAQKEREWGDSRVADAKLQEAWQLAQTLGKDHPFYSITLRHLSDTNYKHYKFEIARGFAMQELQILRTLGNDYQDIVPVLTRLADIDIVENKLDDAEARLIEARNIKDKAMFNTLGRGEIDARQSVVALAKGKVSEYEMLRKRAEEELIKTKVGRPASALSEYGLEIARMSTRANKKMVRPMRKAAEYYTKRGIELAQKSRMDSVSLTLVHCYDRLAEVYEIEGKWLEKLECFKQGAAICMNSPVMSMNERAIVLYQYGKPMLGTQHWDEAVYFLERSRVFAQKTDDKNMLADILFHLAFGLAQQNRWSDALSVKRELVAAFDSAGRKQEADQQRKEIEKITAAIK